MPDSIVLVRHTEVARKWRGRCYGVSDIGLSHAGAAALNPLAAKLAMRRPLWVVHSGLSRTRRLAEAISRAAACPVIADPLWRERDFGAWEGQSWRVIYRASGNAMDGMIDAPGAFRPGGGETSLELARRARRAWQRLPHGNGIVVTHGGPIAALIGQMRGLTVREWLGVVPAPGATVTLARDEASTSPTRCQGCDPAFSDP